MPSSFSIINSSMSATKLKLCDVLTLPARSRTIPFAAIPRSHPSSLYSLDGLDWMCTGARCTSEPFLVKASDDEAMKRRSRTDGGGGPIIKMVNGASCDGLLDSSSARDYGLDLSLYSDDDPSLMSGGDEGLDIPENNVGRVWMSLEYNPETERLHVMLMKIKNLPSRTCSSSNACDPVVRISLLPDERRCLQSKTKLRSCNPRFDESFTFYVSQRDFHSRTLALTVHDVGRHKTLKKLGHVIYPLNEHIFEPNERVVFWRDLDRAAMEISKEKSQVYLSLSFNNVDRLSVGVFSGRNFTPIEIKDGGSSADYYVKVTLMKHNTKIKTKKTNVVRMSINPIFNEMFHFTLPLEDLCIARIDLTILHSVRLHKDEVVGRLSLGSFMFARGPELEHWTQMIANPKEQICKWHDVVVCA